MAAGHAKEEGKGRKSVKGERRRKWGRERAKQGKGRKRVCARAPAGGRAPRPPGHRPLLPARLARSLGPRARLPRSRSLLRLRAGVGAEGEGNPARPRHVPSSTLPARGHSALAQERREARVAGSGRLLLSVGGSVLSPALPLRVLRGRRGGVRPRDPPMGEKRRQRQRNNRAGA